VLSLEPLANAALTEAQAPGDSSFRLAAFGEGPRDPRLDSHQFRIEVLRDLFRGLSRIKQRGSGSSFFVRNLNPAVISADHFMSSPTFAFDRDSDEIRAALAFAGSELGFSRARQGIGELVPHQAEEVWWPEGSEPARRLPRVLGPIEHSGESGSDMAGRFVFQEFLGRPRQVSDFERAHFGTPPGSETGAPIVGFPKDSDVSSTSIPPKIPFYVSR